MVWNWSNGRSRSWKVQRPLWRRLQMQIWPWVRFQLWMPMEWASNSEGAQIFSRFAKSIKARDLRTVKYAYWSARKMSSIHIGWSLSLSVTPSSFRSIFHFLGNFFGYKFESYLLERNRFYHWHLDSISLKDQEKIVWTGTACGSLPKHVSEYY